jgi:hypothetical protein
VIQETSAQRWIRHPQENLRHGIEISGKVSGGAAPLLTHCNYNDAFTLANNNIK